MDQAQASRYAIVVEGRVKADWVDWPCEVEIRLDADGSDGEEGCAKTMFTVTVPDQPALHGVLRQIGNLNLTLISMQMLHAAAV